MKGTFNLEKELDGEDCTISRIAKYDQYEFESIKGTFINGSIKKGYSIMKNSEGHSEYFGELDENNQPHGLGIMWKSPSDDSFVFTKGSFNHNILDRTKEYSILLQINHGNVVEKINTIFHEGLFNNKREVEEWHYLSDGKRLYVKNNVDQDATVPPEIIEGKIWEDGRSAGEFEEEFEFLKGVIFSKSNKVNHKEQMIQILERVRKQPNVQINTNIHNFSWLHRLKTKVLRLGDKLFK